MDPALEYTTISFYRYFSVDDPQTLCVQIRALCVCYRIMGRILIAHEGINGAVSGTNGDIERLKEGLVGIIGLDELTFREQRAHFQTYHKLVVKVRSEVVAFGFQVNVRNAAPTITAQELNRWYDQKKDFVIIDARNEYEFDVGRFKDAVRLPLRNFREFPSIRGQLEKYKNKKLVLYCTGGIRCEKATAYLKENGFPEVYHVQGGVIGYLNEEPKNWEGGSFRV